MQSGAGQLKHTALALTLWSLLATLPAIAEPSLKLASKFVWDPAQHWFGGLSGIEMAPDGASFIAVTDRGRLIEARVEREGNEIKDVQLISGAHIKVQEGRRPYRSERDAEGLAVDRAGNAYVSYEFWHRITTLDPATRQTVRLPAQPPGMRDFHVNGGFEALAIHPDGRLFAITEETRKQRQNIPVFVYDKGEWSLLYLLERQGSFLPVGADFDAEGRLYLLERTVSLLGFRSRIRRLDFRGDTATSETLLTTTPALFDNLEGISVWQDASGATRLTMVSDDNFISVQQTQIVEYVLTN